jgi:hypothetical protein
MANHLPEYMRWWKSSVERPELLAQFVELLFFRCNPLRYSPLFSIFTLEGNVVAPLMALAVYLTEESPVKASMAPLLIKKSPIMAVKLPIIAAVEEATVKAAMAPLLAMKLSIMAEGAPVAIMLEKSPILAAAE